jgi:hypothetical protein
MRLQIVFAVRVMPRKGEAPALFLEDTCAGGSWNADERNAATWDTREELIDALEEAEINGFGGGPLEVVELIQPKR